MRRWMWQIAIQRRRLSRANMTWSVITLALATLTLGCSSAPKKPQIDKDSRLSRHVSDGRQAFDEGLIEEAEKKYRQALKRAWAMDDPYESGTVAYNLAACLTSRGVYEEAADWLVDARVELCRAGASTGNTWLLSAEIAGAQNRFEDAERFVNYAASTCPPCEVPDTCCLCGPAGECCEDGCDCCIVRLTGLGKKLEQQRVTEQCEHDYQARIELARARLAAKQLDLDNAKRHLACACELSKDSCDFSLHADRHDVAAAVHDVEARFLQAGAHRDREATLLRCIGQFREIPNVLDAASESYRHAERIDLAIDRMIRSARILFARGQLQEAWDRVERAVGLSCLGGCQAVEVRLSLTAKEIRDALPPPAESEGSLPAPLNPPTPTEAPAPTDESAANSDLKPVEPGFGDVIELAEPKVEPVPSEPVEQLVPKQDLAPRQKRAPVTELAPALESEADSRVLVPAADPAFAIPALDGVNNETAAQLEP